MMTSMLLLILVCLSCARLVIVSVQGLTVSGVAALISSIVIRSFWCVLTVLTWVCRLVSLVGASALA